MGVGGRITPVVYLVNLACLALAVNMEMSVMA